MVQSARMSDWTRRATQNRGITSTVLVLSRDVFAFGARPRREKGPPVAAVPRRTPTRPTPDRA